MNELILLKEKFDQIAAAKGNAKKPLLKQFVNGEGSESFIETYDFIFNSKITTGLAKKKINKEVNKKFGTLDLSLSDMMSWIRKNNTGTDAIVATVQSWIEAQPEETHEFLKNVFTKDLQIGISEKGLNEALGYEYIPIHEVILAHKWDKHEHKVTGPFTVSLKMDDYRATIIWNKKLEQWEFISRQGQLFEELVELEDIMAGMPTELVFDGGLISIDDTLKAKDRFRKTGKILKTKGPKRGVMFYIYDMLPYTEWKAGKSKLRYSERQVLIEDFATHKLFKPVPKLYIGEDKEVILSLLEKVLADDFEGLMVNTNDGFYETKRTDKLLKVKEFYNCDLRVVGSYEYKHPGNLGGFICEYKDGNTVRVGGGFKHKERAEWWPIRDEFIGKIIEVRYFQESENQNGGKSIRHGHFVQVRDDKNEVSFD